MDFSVHSIAEFVLAMTFAVGVIVTGIVILLFVSFISLVMLYDAWQAFKKWFKRRYW